MKVRRALTETFDGRDARMYIKSQLQKSWVHTSKLEGYTKISLSIAFALDRIYWEWTVNQPIS